MTSAKAVAAHSRVLGLRLKLGLSSLKDIETWADEAILQPGAPAVLADLCLASRAGERITQRILNDLGGVPSGLDLMKAIGPLKVMEASQDQLRRLADNLHPVLTAIEEEGNLPPLLRPALSMANEFWDARMRGAEEMEMVEARMRDLMHAVKEYAAELPEEKPAEIEPEAHSVSAIVVTYNTGDALFECLAALEADLAIDEIVLVNNGNPFETLERVEERWGSSPKLKVTGAGRNRGFAAGVNLGAKDAKGDRLLVINPDAVLQPGSITAFEAAMAGAAEPAIVGGKIFGPDHEEQRGGRRHRLTMRSAAATFLGLSWLRVLNPAFVNINRNTEPEPDGPVPMDAVSGALMYMSASSLRRLGGFDEGYFLHVEDLDLCRRAEADGGSVIYTPHAAALHFGATSDAPSLFVEKHKGAGFRRYFLKFAETPGDRAAAQVLGPLIAFLLAMRARLKRGKARNA
jgi:N-acetylglucosaminyl-diphospho-decaprenol L-rhamnosyltransferase